MFALPLRYASARFLLICCTVALIAVIALQGSAQAAKIKQKAFESPEAAMGAFVQALRGHDEKALLAILGTGGESLISSGDAVDDRERRKEFVRLYDGKGLSAAPKSAMLHRHIRFAPFLTVRGGAMSRRNLAKGILAAAVIAFALLSYPAPDPPIPAGASGKPFTWKQDEKWKALEASFLEAREIGCRGLERRIGQGFRQAGKYLSAVDVPAVRPDAPVLSRLETLSFGLGTAVAACPERLTDYVHLVTKTRSLLKRRSQGWDLNDRAARDRLYRLIYGGRAALEEVMLQAPPGTVPALVKGEDVPSAAPSYAFQHGVLRSGDILVSRGGAPTSALIARGNDYPGNFSHVALFHVDETTGEPGIVESHIEMGVVVSTVEQYVRDKKLRIMVLRLRPDLPQVKADPLLPHRAAKRAHDEVKSRHIPYDFEMDFRDPSKWFCSEVASWAYRQHGVELWKGTTRMSAPGVVRWLSYFGVTHFETQAPADLEYDPQLSVVAEWRDPETLWQDHVDNAVVEALLEGADEGDTIPAPWWKLAAVRLAKGYSVVLNLFGGVGPVPEGMDATAALRNLELSRRHETMRRAVLARAEAFRQAGGYRPPYWELVRMANDVRKEGGRR